MRTATAMLAMAGLVIFLDAFATELAGPGPRPIVVPLIPPGLGVVACAWLLFCSLDRSRIADRRASPSGADRRHPPSY